MKFKVSDDDGLFSIVNSDRYKTFVEEDWSLDQLVEHFVAEMNNRHIIVWRADSNGGGEWIMEVLYQPSNKPSIRDFSAVIEVTNGYLYLVNYTDLTMAAQFDDVALPSKHNADWKIPVENGTYNVTVKQLVDLDEYDDEDETAFEIILIKTDGDVVAPVEKVFWWDV